MNSPLILPEEQACLDLIVELFNAYYAMPPLGTYDQEEFNHALHAAQGIVMTRIAVRLCGLKPPDDYDWDNESEEGEDPPG